MLNRKEVINYGVQELMVKGNLAVIKELFSIDYIAHAGEKSFEGHAFIEKWTKQMHSSLHNIKLKSLEFLVHDDHSISWQRTFTATHVKNLRGIPASNKRVTWTELVVSKFKENKIIEEWLVSELAAALLLKLPVKSNP